MLADELPKPRKAEHLAFGVVSLDQAVAVEEGTIASIKHRLLLLVTHPRHEPQGHPPGPQLLGIPTMPEVGQVVARVGVAQATALRVEDGVEAGDKHVGGDLS